MSGRLRAVLTLSVMLATFTVSLFRPEGSLSRLPDHGKVSDPEVYDRILSRLGAGEPYYTIVGDELRSKWVRDTGGLQLADAAPVAKSGPASAPGQTDSPHYTRRHVRHRSRASDGANIDCLCGSDGHDGYRNCSADVRASSVGNGGSLGRWTHRAVSVCVR